MKKVMYSVFIALIATVLVASTALASYTLSPRLLAGQTQFAGVVKVTGNADGTLTITFMLRAGTGWCMTDAAVHVGDELSDFPQNEGGAIPGQFDNQFDFGGCVKTATVTIDDMGFHGQWIYIAIHANVYGPDGQQNTAWVVNCGDLEAGQFPGNNWSAFFRLPANAWY